MYIPYFKALKDQHSRLYFVVKSTFKNTIRICYLFKLIIQRFLQLIILYYIHQNHTANLPFSTQTKIVLYSSYPRSKA